MSLPPLQLVEPLDAGAGHGSIGSSSAGPDIAQIVQSAAFATGCPIAILYLEDGHGFSVVEACGLDAGQPTPAARRFLGEAAHLCPDGLLTAREASHPPGGDPEAPHLCGTGVASVRFVAGIRVAGGAGRRCGVLVVADMLPHADLGAVHIALLRAHAAELSSQMELSSRTELSREQAMTRQLRRFDAIAANANDAVPIGRTRPGGLLRSQALHRRARVGPIKGLRPGMSDRVSLPQPSSTAGCSALDPLRPAPPLWEPIEIRLLNSGNDGTELWDDLAIVPVWNGDGCYTRWVSVQRDAGTSPPSSAPRNRISGDGPTRLHDRDSFMDRLNDGLGRSMSNADLRCVVLLIELDRLGRTDDSHALYAGDFLLTEQTRRLKTAVRLHDTLGRIGDGRFAMFIEGFDEMDFVTKLANRIIETMGHPLRFGNREIQPSCSIGVVHANGYRHGAEAILVAARIALQRAKRDGTGSQAIVAGSTGGDMIPDLQQS